MEKTIEELIYEETEQRLEEMSRADYQFPEKIRRGDVVGIACAVGVSLVLIILCMIGVIV